MLVFYILIGFYFTVIITHALTKANIKPQIIDGPCTIRYIDRYTRGCFKIKDEYIIDAMTMQHPGTEYIKETMIRESLYKLIRSTPKELIQFTSEVDPMTGNCFCRTQIIIVDPNFK